MSYFVLGDHKEVNSECGEENKQLTDPLFILFVLLCLGATGAGAARDLTSRTTFKKSNRSVASTPCARKHLV